VEAASSPPRPADQASLTQDQVAQRAGVDPAFIHRLVELGIVAPGPEGFTSADYARRGEVLVTDEVVAASTGVPVRFEPIGAVELKGLNEAVSLHVARRST
jgi:hypothetical protein